jgi:hypothetical protein
LSPDLDFCERRSIRKVAGFHNLLHPTSLEARPFEGRSSWVRTLSYERRLKIAKF